MSRQKLSKIIRMDELDMKLLFLCWYIISSKGQVKEKLVHVVQIDIYSLIAANVTLKLFIGGEYPVTSWSPNTY